MPNKAQFIDSFAERLDGDKKRAAAALDAMIDTVYAAIARGEKVAIAGFGVFEQRNRAERTARNPATGASVHVPAGVVPAFRPGTEFRQITSGATDVMRERAERTQLAVVRAGATARNAQARAANAVQDVVKGVQGRASSVVQDAVDAVRDAQDSVAAAVAKAQAQPARKASPAKKAAKKTAPAKKAAKKATKKAAPAKKAAKKTAKKTATRTAAKKLAANKSTPATKKAAAKKLGSSPAKKTAAKKTAAKKTAAKKTAAKKTAAKKTAKKAPARKR